VANGGEACLCRFSIRTDGHHRQTPPAPDAALWAIYGVQGGLISNLLTSSGSVEPRCGMEKAANVQSGFFKKKQMPPDLERARELNTQPPARLITN
jgi:hypothetical protein